MGRPASGTDEGLPFLLGADYVLAKPDIRTSSSLCLMCTQICAISQLMLFSTRDRPSPDSSPDCPTGSWFGKLAGMRREWRRSSFPRRRAAPAAPGFFLKDLRTRWRGRRSSWISCKLVPCVHTWDSSLRSWDFIRPMMLAMAGPAFTKVQITSRFAALRFRLVVALDLAAAIYNFLSSADFTAVRFGGGASVAGVTASFGLGIDGFYMGGLWLRWHCL